MKRKRFFYICVEENRDLEVAFRIYDFLLLYGIKEVSNPLIKDKKCIFRNDELLKKLTEKYEEIVVICVSRDLFIRMKDYKDTKLSFKEKILHHLSPSKFFAIGKLSIYGSNIKVTRILLPMNTIEKAKASPFAVFIHELLHLKRKEDCDNPICLGHGHGRYFYLCDNCLKILKEIIEESRVDVDGERRNSRSIQKTKRTLRN